VRVARTFPAGPQAPGQARDLVRDLALAPDTRANLELIVTELVANSVVHGADALGAEVTVRLRSEQARVRGEICDQGDGFEWEPHLPDLSEPGGLGLMLVDRLAERWGTGRNRTGCVWFVCAGA
jgi:two-component sensor histidine kinase